MFRPLLHPMFHPAPPHPPSVVARQHHVPHFARRLCGVQYNVWVLSLDRVTAHRKLLFKRVLEKPTLTKFTMVTRTVAAEFMLLIVQHQDPAGLLNELLPDDGKVWRHWKATILEQLRHRSDESILFESKVAGLDGFMEKQDLLRLLYNDAWVAYNGSKDYLQVKSS